MKCAWKQTFGIDCFMCGIQRSFIHLIHGDFFLSLKTYPALLPLILLVIYTGAHLYFKFPKGARNIVIQFSFAVGIMVINYCYHIYTGEIYHT